jgi:hypothetical protein
MENNKRRFVELDRRRTDAIPKPGTRPVCPGCLKERRSQTYLVDYWDKTKGIHYWKWKGYGYFCSLTCATAWANQEIGRRINGHE